jgi:hypothetical protein
MMSDHALDVLVMEAEDTVIVEEVCNTCGRTHGDLSPICVDCWMAEQSTDEYDQAMDAYYNQRFACPIVDEPVHYEIP